MKLRVALPVLVGFAVSIGCSGREPEQRHSRKTAPAMQTFKWSDIYSVSQKRRVATDAEIASIQRLCGELPAGYVEFIRTFGFGELNGIHILPPKDVLPESKDLREKLGEWCSSCEEFGDPIVIPQKSIDDAVALARTDWGDTYFCSPSDAGVLWYMWRSHDWDSKPSFLPHGFRNPFVHQVPGEASEEIDEGPYIFDPVRDVYSRHVYVKGPHVTADHLKSLAELAIAVQARVPVSKLIADDEAEYTRTFIGAWGSEFRFGYRHQDSNYFLYIQADAEHEEKCNALLASLTEQGYVFEDSE